MYQAYFEYRKQGMKPTLAWLMAIAKVDGFMHSIKILKRAM